MKVVETGTETEFLFVSVAVVLGLLLLLPQKTAAPTAATNKKVFAGNSDVCTAAPHFGSRGFECRSSSWYSQDAHSKTRLDLAAYSTLEGKQDERQGMIVRTVELPNEKYHYHMIRFYQSGWGQMRYCLLDARQSLRSCADGSSSRKSEVVDYTLVTGLGLQLHKNASTKAYPGDGLSISLNHENAYFYDVNPMPYVFNSVDEYDNFTEKFMAYAEWLDKEHSSSQPHF